MSRTYRRKTSSSNHRFGWDDLYWHITELKPIPGFTTLQRVRIPVDSKQYKKALAVYHSDKTTNFKEPGPSWFRNLYRERPMRRRNKLELRKYALNNDYEPMIHGKIPLGYWT